MKFEIKNRWNGSVIFTAEIECGEDTAYGVKLGLAVKVAVKENASLNDAQLIGAQLNYAQLNGAQLNYAQLNGAQLNYAQLNYAQLNGARLNYAQLNYARLNGAQLIGAQLIGAQLIGAQLNYAQLNYAQLNYAQLNDAQLNYAQLNYAQLNSVTGNMKEIRSMQADTYTVAWTDLVMQIGCQCHAIADWWRFGDEQILQMGGREALRWWRKWKPILLQVVAARTPETNEAD